MIHQLRDKKRINKKKKIIKYIIVFIIFFVLLNFGLLGFLGNFFNFIGRPIWNTEKALINEIDESGHLWQNKKIVFKENILLKEENFYLKNLMINYSLLEKENNHLKEILGRLPSTDDYILANILAKPNSSPYDTLIIDIGLKDEIKENDNVFVNGDIPIGYVSRVYEKTSLVSLYTNPGQETEGFIDDSNISVSLIGRGGGNFEMIIPMELSIGKGAVIYLPGQKSLALAKVEEVISSPSDPFKKVILSSPVNVQNIKWVQVKQK